MTAPSKISKPSSTSFMVMHSGGTVTKTTVYYPGGAMRINGTLYYVLKDHLGSASVVTDNSGTVVGDQRYYPFGFTRLATGSMYTDKLYTSQREMAGLGIYHYGARFYSPKLGRFLSADSLVPNPFNPQDYNRFAYVRNNPVRYVDPTGHICVQNNGGLDEFAMPGNCNGKPPTNLETGLQGSPSGWTKPSKPKSGPLITIVPPGPSSGGIVTVPISTSSGGPGVLTDIGTGVGEFGQVVAATSELQTVNVGNQVILYGTRANRGTAGLNPFTNNINLVNQGRLFSPWKSMRGSLGSYFTWAGIAIDVGFNAADYASGNISGTRFAAATTVNLLSGLVIAAISGAIAGGVAAGAVSFGFGAIPGAIIGAGIGIVFAIAASQALEYYGVNDAATDLFESQYERINVVGDD